MLSKKERDNQLRLVSVIEEQERMLQAALDRSLHADPARHDYIIGGLEGALRSAIKDLSDAIDSTTPPAKT